MVVKGEPNIDKIAELIKRILQNRDYNSSVTVTVKEKEQGYKPLKN